MTFWSPWGYLSREGRDRIKRQSRPRAWSMMTGVHGIHVAVYGEMWIYPARLRLAGEVPIDG